MGGVKSGGIAGAAVLACALSVVALAATSGTGAPAITGISALSGHTGEVITVSGTGFTGTTSVKLNGVTAAFKNVAADGASLQATVPVAATTGFVSVTTHLGTATGTDRFVVLPKIASFTPASAVAGKTVTIAGTGLNDAATVSFVGSSSPVPVSTYSPTKVTAVVPNDATSGPLTVEIRGGDVATSVATFKAAPTFSSSSAVDGVAGDTVVITGANLTGATVKFGTFTAAATPVSATEVDATVPGAPFSSGRIGVTTPRGTVVSAQTFFISKVTGVRPAAAAAGATITIAGQGLGDADTVDFAGHTGSVPASKTATGVKLVVPSNATTGLLTVHMPDGTALSTPLPFKPLSRVTGFSPSGPVVAGQIISVTGTNLSTTGSNTVKIGSLVVPGDHLGAAGPLSFSLTIPNGALTGAVKVANANGTTTSPTPLRIKPTIDSLTGSNDHGKAGDHIVLTGKSFKGTSSVKLDTVAAPFTVAADGLSLTFTVPAAGVSGPIIVTNAGGGAASDDFAVTPVIKSFKPTTAAVGTTITLTGTGFGGADQVLFGGSVEETPTNVTATSLKVVVPPGAATGGLQVDTATAGTSAASGNLTITFSVQSVSPTIGTVGTLVTLTGVGLSAVTEVDFNGHAGTDLQHPDATHLTAHVPADGSGAVTVKKGTAAPIGVPGTFTLLTVDSFSPAAGLPGGHVVVTGHGFTAATGVTFDGTPAFSFTVNSDTQITATAPAGAADGAIEVDVASAAAQSSSSFTFQKLLINEVRTGTNGFVELYNASPDAINLGQVEILYRPAGETDGTNDEILKTYVVSDVIGSHEHTLFSNPWLAAAGGGVALELRGVISATMGYGTAANAFVHGTAVAAPASGHSVGRSPDGTDTGDDSADFADYAVPTPGLTNAVVASFNVVSAVSGNTHSVTVTFDAAPDALQAANLANYSIPGLTLSGTPSLSVNAVTIATTNHSAVTYTVTVSGVTRASDLQPLTVQTADFAG